MRQGARGLTLVELLAALVLLGLLMGAMAAWMRTTAQAASIASTRLPWMNAAEAALDRIGEDFLAGDFDSDPEDERLIVSDGELRIETRVSGQAIHQYHLQPSGRLVRLQQHLHPMEGQSDQERLLVDQVGQFSCRTIGENELRIIEVTIISIDGLQAQRSWPWP